MKLSKNFDSRLNQFKKYILTKDLIEVKKIKDSDDYDAFYPVYNFIYDNGRIFQASGELCEQSVLPFQKKKTISKFF